jgi:pimeloyl-ACP methyl ester carboxylesterase
MRGGKLARLIAVCLRGGLLVLVSSFLIAACGSSDQDRRTGPPPARNRALGGCARSGPNLRLTSFPAPAERVPAAVVGRGPTGAVFANQSGGSVCDWLPFARRLAVQGVRSLLFDYSGADYVDETRAAVGALRAAGGRRVVLVGASLGGQAAIRVAARPPAGLAAVATLSAERIGRSLGDVLPYARRVQIPSLYVGSTDDGYTTFGVDTRALYRATPAHRKRIVVVRGDAHGVDLLSGMDGARIGRLLSGFIRNG